LAVPCHSADVTDSDAYVLRDATGTAGVAKTTKAVAEVLAHWDIPHLVVGGVAVQECGYPRVTIDVDIVVPDVLEATEFLTADLTGNFQRLPGYQDRVKDRETGVIVDLLPAGHVVKNGCKVPFPQPTKASDQPQFVPIEKLISLKLDSWFASKTSRLRDKADVIELIIRRQLPRDLAVDEAIKGLYVAAWDELKAEQ
jgi:hypothetical protein